MDLDKETVEVYDNATGEHYTRDATVEEKAIYEQIAAGMSVSPPPLGQSDETPTSPADSVE